MSPRAHGNQSRLTVGWSAASVAFTRMVSRQAQQTIRNHMHKEGENDATSNLMSDNFTFSVVRIGETSANFVMAFVETTSLLSAHFSHPGCGTT